MESDSNASDAAAQSTAAAAEFASTGLAHNAMDTDTSTHPDQDRADRELDLAVNRFLESELCSAPDDSNSIDIWSLEDSSAELSLRDDDTLFMDSGSSLDVPDLDFGTGFESFTHGADVGVSHMAAATVQDTSSATKSLRVLMPASTLSPVIVQPTTTQLRSSAPTSGGRKRVKDELEYLRQQVHGLECQLEELRRGSFGDDKVLSSGLHSRDGGLWERIARHQQDEKQKALADNQRLKEALEDQLQLARSLEKVLRRHRDLSWLERPQTKRLRVAATASDDAGDFELLTAKVETLYSEIDTVLREAQLGTKAAEHGAQLKFDSEGGVFIEAVDCFTLPFELHTTGAAIWKLMTTSSMDYGNGQHQAVDVTDDTARVLLTVNLTLRRVETVVQVRLVGKRIIEADRTVFVWCAMGETQGHVHGKNFIRVRESGWTVVKAADTSGDDVVNLDQQPRTTVQSVLRMHRELTTDGVDSKSPEGYVGLLTDVVLGAFHQNLTLMRQMIESLVLKSALPSNDVLIR